MSNKIYNGYIMCRLWNVKGMAGFAAFWFKKSNILSSVILAAAGSGVKSVAEKNNAKLFKIILCLSAMLFLSVYVCRLIDMKESIVVFKPEDNIVFRIIRYIWYLV